MKVIAVTGGTGFVGQGVVSELLGRGYRVRALVRNENSAKKLTLHPNLSFIIGSATNSDDVAKVLQGCDALIHLVGIRRAETKKTGLTYDDVDVGSAITSVEAMKKVGLQRILFLSAAAIGKSYYVRSKAKAEKAVMDSRLDWTIWRPAIILGPGQDWPIVISPILGLLAVLPGKIGEVARLAGNISRKRLAESFVAALQDADTIGKILEVPEIQQMTKR